MESFCPATNTFITPNFELGFSLLEINEIVGLPILGDLYEEFIPFDVHLASEFEEFIVVFQQVFSLAKMSRNEHQKAKANLWIKNMLPKGLTNMISFFEKEGVFKKRVTRVNHSSVSPRSKTLKSITTFEDCPKFLSYVT